MMSGSPTRSLRKPCHSSVDNPGSPEHGAKFADAVDREGSLVGFLVDLDTDDIAVGKVVVVADNGFEEVQILAKQIGDVTKHADGGGRRHQAASLLG